MSKQWYFQVMGAEFGPVTSSQLKEKARQGQIDLETLVRLGREGKWQPATRIKGLLEPVAAAVEGPGEAIRVQGPRVSAEERMPPPAAAAAEHQRETAGLQMTPVEERTYHLSGERTSETPSEASPEGDYDFFEFVAFDQAIGHALHDVLVGYCRAHGQTMTQVTRRAIAEFLGRKDLLGEATGAAKGNAENNAPPVGEPPSEIKG